MWKGYDGSDSFGGVVISEGAMISTGAKVLGSRGQLVVGRGSVVGANAVLTESIGNHEIWADVCTLHTTCAYVGLIPDMDANREVDGMFFLASNGLLEGHCSKINFGR